MKNTLTPEQDALRRIADAIERLQRDTFNHIDGDEFTRIKRLGEIRAVAAAALQPALVAMMKPADE